MLLELVGTACMLLPCMLATGAPLRKFMNWCIPVQQPSPPPRSWPYLLFYIIYSPPCYCSRLQFFAKFNVLHLDFHLYCSLCCGCFVSELCHNVCLYPHSHIPTLQCSLALEIMVKCRPSKVQDVGITFGDRVAGASTLSLQ